MRIKILPFEQCKTKEDILRLVKDGTDWIRMHQGERLLLQLVELDKLSQDLLQEVGDMIAEVESLPQNIPDLWVEIHKRKEVYQKLQWKYEDEWFLDFHETHPTPAWMNGERVDVLTLDVTYCNTWWELESVIKATFGLPDYYGKNTDALWDLLRLYTTDRVHIRIIGLKHLPKDLMEIKMTKILTVFDDVHRELPNMTFEIVDSMQHPSDVF